MKMTEFRRVSKILKARPTLEGAGVKLKRAFGDREVLDPFLLLDDFHSDNPSDYVAGFPRHPHRGIETVTYMLEGMIEHEDSVGNRGFIRSGDVQWMTAGSGIIHQEMPKGSDGHLWGLQLWVNLPASHKMDDPRYREIKKEDVPEVEVDAGVKIKVIRGDVQGSKGPIRDIVVDCEYLDITMQPGTMLEQPIKKSNRALAYVLEGSGYFDPEKTDPIANEQLVIFGDGDKVKISAEDKRLRYLLLSGTPIGEPIAWSGPIVMNTQEELEIAFDELDKGTFLKHMKSSGTRRG